MLSKGIGQIRAELNKLSKQGTAVLAVMSILSGGWCLYWYEQWREWKRVNDTVLAYELPGTPAEAREQQLAKWKGKHGDVLHDVQQQAETCGIQIHSFSALQRERQQYELELSGTYGDYIYFLNNLEREIPLAEIFIVRMEYENGRIAAVMKI